MLGAVGRATTRIELGIGALAPGMLRLAGELANGVLPLLFPPEHYFGVMPLLEAGMQRRSPALEDLDMAAYFWS